MIDPQRMIQRASFKEALRRFFQDRGYIELDTPVLVPMPGTEVYLRYFETAYRDFAGRPRALFLRSSPELHMKQALSAGLNKIFQVAPSFRNGGENGPWHHPEFTMLEWYATGLDHDGMMAETEALVRALARALPQAIPLPATFERISVFDAVSTTTGITLLDGDAQLAAKACAAGVVSVRADDDFETAFFKILLEKVEPYLAAKSAVFLFDYPASQAALARVVGDRAKRFELYLNGVEICNAFWELADPGENRRRLLESSAKRQSLGFEVPPLDETFLAAIERGLPDCSGNALGVDRLLAVLGGDDSLDQVVPFRQSFFTPDQRES